MKHLNKIFESEWNKPTDYYELLQLLENIFDSYLDDGISEMREMASGTQNFKWLEEGGVTDNDFKWDFVRLGGFFLRLFMPEYEQFGIMGSLSDINSLYSEIDEQKDFLRGLKPKLMTLDKYDCQWRMKIRGLGQNQISDSPFKIEVKGRGYIVSPPVVNIIIVSPFRSPNQGSSYLFHGPKW